MAKEIVAGLEEDISCKHCGSKQTYIRLKDNSRVCRSCGYVERRGEVVDGS